MGKKLGERFSESLGQKSVNMFQERFGYRLGERVVKRIGGTLGQRLGEWKDCLKQASTILQANPNILQE